MQFKNIISKIDVILEDEGGGGDYSGLPSTNTQSAGLGPEGLDLDDTTSGVVPYYGFLQSRLFNNYLGRYNGKPKRKKRKRKKLD